MAVSRKPIARPESSITEEKRTTRLKTIVFGSILLLSVWGLFEGVARVAVWSDSPLFKPIRRAPYFAPYDSENYQKLNAYFASGAEDATIPDPELVLHKPTSQPVRELVAGAPPRIFSYSLAFAVNAVRLVVNNVFRQEQSVLDHGENRLTRLRELNQLILDQCIALLDRRFDGL